MVGRVDPLSGVVQQGGQQELLVVWSAVARQFEDLEAVILRVAFRVVPRVLLHVGQRGQQGSEPLESIERRFEALHLRLQVSVGVFLAEQLLQLGDARPPRARHTPSARTCVGRR